jgi:hypothetical protein
MTLESVERNDWDPQLYVTLLTTCHRSLDLGHCQVVILLVNSLFSKVVSGAVRQNQ